MVVVMAVVMVGGEGVEGVVEVDSIPIVLYQAPLYCYKPNPATERYINHQIVWLLTPINIYTHKLRKSLIIPFSFPSAAFSCEIRGYCPPPNATQEIIAIDSA